MLNFTGRGRKSNGNLRRGRHGEAVALSGRSKFEKSPKFDFRQLVSVCANRNSLSVKVAGNLPLTLRATLSSSSLRLKSGCANVWSRYNNVLLLNNLLRRSTLPGNLTPTQTI